MKTRSLVTRLTLLQQLTAALMITIFGVSSLWLANRTIRDEEGKVLASMARRVAGEVDNELAEEGNLVRSAVATLEEEPGGRFRIEIYGPSGAPLASTEPKVTLNSHPGPLPGPGKQDDRGGRHRAAERSASGALVVASISDQDRLAHLAALRRALLWCAIPLLLLTFVADRWVGRRALRPLAEMGDRARSASVESGVRSLGSPTGVNEIDRLGDSFNRLLGRLDDLLRAERRFTSNASHELRTPLTVLSGELETMLADPLLSGEVRAGIGRASDQVHVMRDLVEALLLLRRAGESAARAETGFEPVNVADLAVEVVRVARAGHPGRTADLGLTAPDEAMVSGQPVLLETAIRNLTDNAIKFSAPGREVRVAVQSNATHVDVIVDDAGDGIPSEERDRIFEPFYRAPEARATMAGLGLGLPLLRQVARAHGGDVTVVESPLGGARFTLSLPVWQSSSNERSEALAPAVRESRA